ncbi:hypothetical protein A2Y85_01670 [candidate division WOR-3 bacterium RBG_13_43_14]|uniref:CNNM transmembrane domain-containing protein n=1 Tax=candidate division WOR-3 bacterium RBG_13_43_14 TaxID=1802590 RepID=A0A1F4U3M9_UNCW3|nr:MAG: hypothetical protein A2Y85_01670 [candidate division WOR-3 bacterium RBG_13_43_14]
MFIFTVFFIVVAIALQAISVAGVEKTVGKLKGMIRDENDLQYVKRTINMNMQLAILYIALSFLYIVALVIAIVNGASLGSAAINLLVFGIITWPVGIIGRSYEKKIKQLKIENNNAKIAARFLDYLTQWLEPRWQISDRDII